jgi:RHS repeat-associated protein
MGRDPAGHSLDEPSLVIEGLPVGNLRSRRQRRRSLLLLAVILGGLIPAVVSVAKPLHALASSAYETAALADSPSVYYRLGESSGTTANDDSGNGYNGTYTSNTTLGATGALYGDSNTGVSSSGEGVMLNYSSGSGLPSGNSARTVELWFNTTSSSTQTVVAWGSQAGDEYFGVDLSPPSGSNNIRMEGYYDYFDFTSPTSFHDGTWHYLAITYDGTYVRCYLDGAQIDAAKQFTNTLNTQATSFQVGDLPWESWPYTGTLDETAVYGSALSATRLAAHFDAGMPAVPTPHSSNFSSTLLTDNPSVYYRLGESSGATWAADSSGNGRNGRYDSSATEGVTPGPEVADSSATGASDSGTTIAQYASGAGLPTGNAARTVETWVKDGSGGSMRTSFGTGTGDEGFGLGDVGNAVEVSDYATNQSISTPYAIDGDGNWHQIAVSYDGTNAYAYLDGERIGTFSSFGPINTVNEPGLGLVLGNCLTLSCASTGDIAEYAVYPTALPATRIRAHYLASGNTPAPTGGALTPAQAAGGGNNNTGTCSGVGVVNANATSKPVDTESGNFWHTFTDMSISGRSCPLQVSRTYNSQNASTDGPFGYGWTLNAAMSLAVTGSSPNQVATITQENSSQASFTQPASGSTWPPAAPRFIATLVHNDGGTWTLTRQGQNSYTFNSSGQLTAEADLNGYTTTLSYTSGNLTTITDPASRTLTLGWTGSHITSLTDANVTPNRTVSYSYDGSGNLQDVTDVAGGDTHFAYDGSHRITTMKDPVCQALGGSCPGVQNHYDGSARIDWQKDQLNRETTFAYSGTPQTAAGGSTTITDPKGNETVDAYQWGLLTSETKGYGTSSAATTRFQYDPDTLAPTAVQDPNGNIIVYTVDSSGNVLTATDPLGRVTTKTYNAFNEPTAVEDGNGITTTYTYDSNGNLATMSRPVSGTSCTCQVVTYNHANGTYPGDLTSMVDPDSKTWSYGYDSNGNRVETKDPLGNVSASVYNADDWLTATYTAKAGCTWGSTPPTGCNSTYETAYSYVIPGGSTTDEFGDVQTVTDSLSHVTTYGYDADRQKTSVKDGNSNTTTYTFDVANELTTTTRPDSTTQVTDYNADGSVEDQKNGAGTTIMAYGYDANGRVTTVTDALSNVTTYSYDVNGNKLTQQDPGGNCATPSKCTTLTYDADNEPKTVSYSDGVTPNITSVTYDSDGQRTGMSDGTGSPAWAFDNLHRLTSYTSGNSDTVSYVYNLRNEPTSITYPNSVGTVTRAYDDAGGMTSTTDWNSKQTTFAYDDNSNQTGQTSPSTTNVTDTFGFNAADQMTSVSDSNGSTLFSATYTRDSNGQLASDNSQAANQQDYKYTSLNQLCYAGSSSSTACSSPPSSSYPYGFNSADNLTTNNGTAQQYNNADELCWTVSGTSSNACGSVPTGATTFNYDDRGNRTSQVPNAGSATCTAYDQADRLTSVKTGTGSSCTTPTTVGTYAYDGSGLRQSKAVSGTTTHFTWDESGGLPMLLQEKAGSTVTSYLYGPGGLPVEQIVGSTTTYLHHDQIGSTRLITDSAGATGTATTLTFDPYGNSVSTSGSLTTNLQFAGEYLDESGLYYNRARYYDPATAQMLSRDPAVASTGAPYAYAAGSPTNVTDPTGLISADPAQQQQINQQCSQWAEQSMCRQAAFCTGDNCTAVGDIAMSNVEIIENGIAHCHDGAVTLQGGYQVTMAQAERLLRENQVAAYVAQQEIDYENGETNSGWAAAGTVASAAGSCAATGLTFARFGAPIMLFFGAGELVEGAVAVGGCAVGVGIYAAGGVRVP